MAKSVVVSYARTPFGKQGGNLASVKAVDLGAVALRAAVQKCNMNPDEIDMAIIGQAIPGGCGQIPARQAVLKAKLPASLPVDAVNKVCASSIRAVTLADQVIRSGDAKIILTGGMESMSNVPFASFDMRKGRKMFNTEFVDLMVKDGLWDPFYDCHMAVHGGKVASEYNITREMQDQWAVGSQKKAQNAIKKGYLCEEIVPVFIGDNKFIEMDEAPRADSTIEKLRKLKPLFVENNTVTPGNAPGTSDGACALLIMEQSEAERRNINYEAVILGHAMYSEDPQYIATVPGHAIFKLLKQMDLQVTDIDLFEINEAFAAVTLVSGKMLGCDMEKVNVNGGAIAYGHPLGASGGRILMSLIGELKRRHLKYGVAAICSGTGQGDAVLIENCQR